MNEIHAPIPNYPVRVFWSDEDAAWIATCTAFPYVAAFGDTREQAARDIAPLLDEAAHTYAQEGWSLPDLDPEPTASGQTRLRLPCALHDRAIERARIDGVSLNTFIVAAVAEKVGLAEGLMEMRAIRNQIAALIARQHILIDNRGTSRTYESRQEPRPGYGQPLDLVALSGPSHLTQHEVHDA
jgi:predicted RNase H-like HicB family nuclease